jgi:hypothetical protein
MSLTYWFNARGAVMAFDRLRDPRYEPLQPTWEEADAWASRERKRREAWLAGPSEVEQDEWARRARRRSMFGPSESALGPSTEEVAEWVAREQKRRQAWLAGPTDEEKREWAHRQTRRVHGRYPPSELTPTVEEIDGWAAKEHARRQAWLAGPTEEEKRRWMRREAGSAWDDQADRSTLNSDVADMADRLLREADLATKGSVAALARAPFAIWSYLVRTGRTFEDDLYQPPPRRRVRF